MAVRIGKASNLLDATGEQLAISVRLHHCGTGMRFHGESTTGGIHPGQANDRRRSIVVCPMVIPEADVLSRG